MTDDISLTLHQRIADIDATDWNACSGEDNPFVSHAFLAALEESGSVGDEAGWLPRHLALRDGDGQLAAVVPAYFKSHSSGEYVFDHGWAEAFERAGGAYYPKLQAAVPFSPVPGPRLLRKPDSILTTAQIGEALIKTCRQFDLSSAHITFCSEQEWIELGQAGWMQRVGAQFHWHNQGYKTFDDFLASLSANHRKSIRRERRDANGCGLTFRTLCGADIKAHHWDAFYKFYQATVDRKWGAAYLNRKFFSLLSEKMADKLVLVIAEQNGSPVAGALNFMGVDTLYGRNWGCVGQWPFLHFEICYYRALDFAIERGLKRVEAGAQGAHKIQRGYLPQPTYSAHWIANPSFSRAVEDFLKRERAAVVSDIAELATFAPFRCDP